MGWALGAPLSIVVGQPMAYVASVLGLFLLWKHRVVWKRDPFFWPVILFFLAVVASACFGLRPGLSLRKMDRLLLLLPLLQVPFLWCLTGLPLRSFTSRMMTAFLIGASLKAGFDLFRVPWAVYHGTALFDTGNMREPQMYLVAVCLVMGGLLTSIWRGRLGWPLLALALNAYGLIIHFKRGCWMAFLAAAVIMIAVSGRKRVLAGIFLAVAALVFVPQVRERLMLLQTERTNPGGRLVLWTQVAPALYKAYPLGIGWKAVKNDDFLPYAKAVPKNLNHLHNNVLELALELGWHGALIWLAWMTAAWLVMVRNWRRLQGVSPQAAGLALGILGAFSGLLLNGMVEYSFGDTEVFLVFILLMTCASVQAQALKSDPQGAA